MRNHEGDKNPNSVLSPEKVMHIRFLLAGGMTQDRIACLYGVSRPTIGHIKTGHRWPLQSSKESEENGG